jgi:hypothetical protein
MMHRHGHNCGHRHRYGQTRETTPEIQHNRHKHMMDTRYSAAPLEDARAARSVDRNASTTRQEAGSREHMHRSGKHTHMGTCTQTLHTDTHTHAGAPAQPVTQRTHSQSRGHSTASHLACELRSANTSNNWMATPQHTLKNTPFRTEKELPVTWHPELPVTWPASRIAGQTHKPASHVAPRAPVTRPASRISKQHTARR